ncbi:sigma-70 family RNA polymerase sigma factor [Lentisphaera marina]|uniref:RNA polymerase sigma factor n=1 Tax=Lentisphaera marina TaxID=1111041 RepID=UPI00236698E8|nr:sigma-70 family RNA polymerase sigma factor [Lentisphaera marina]MDD7986024.1 sigma-70 family RNA polymerase sigma factor [Lentisphaera marina]
MSEDKYLTRQTLLIRAQNDDDHDAWEEFISFYKAFIYHILQKMNVRSRDDMDDLVQDVLVKLWKGLKTYDKSKSKFRTWISLITKNTVISFFRKKSVRPDLVGVESAELENNFTTYSESELEEIFENEWRAYLCTIAYENIQKLFTGNALEVFKLSQEGMSSGEIAEKLGLTKESVYVLSSRVKSKFTSEVKKLINNLEF